MEKQTIPIYKSIYIRKLDDIIRTYFLLFLKPQYYMSFVYGRWQTFWKVQAKFVTLWRHNVFWRASKRFSIWTILAKQIVYKILTALYFGSSLHGFQCAKNK